MAVHLNHTIVSSRDRDAAATFLSEILGLPKPEPFGPFMGVRVDNDVTLDYMQVDGPVTSQHYAFLVSEDEFDAIMTRIRERGVRFWADPGHHEPGEINTHWGGRGVYFEDPDGHNLEALTQPYGNGS